MNKLFFSNVSADALIHLYFNWNFYVFSICLEAQLKFRGFFPARKGGGRGFFVYLCWKWEEIPRHVNLDSLSCSKICISWCGNLITGNNQKLIDRIGKFQDSLSCSKICNFWCGNLITGNNQKLIDTIRKFQASFTRINNVNLRPSLLWQKPREDGKPESDSALVRRPGYLEMLGHTFFFGGILVGPQVRDGDGGVCSVLQVPVLQFWQINWAKAQPKIQIFLTFNFFFIHLFCTTSKNKTKIKITWII